MRPAVIVIRDPRDAYTSFYHYSNNYENRPASIQLAPHYVHDAGRPIEEDFAAFLRAKLTHQSFPRFMYREFVESWHGQPDTHVVRYEDCLADAGEELTKILATLDVVIDPDRVETAVQQNSFESHTKRMYGEKRLPGDSDNRRFVRKGVAGDWVNHFNLDAAELLESIDGSILRQFGYEQDASWIDRHFGSNAPEGHASTCGSSHTASVSPSSQP